MIDSYQKRKIHTNSVFTGKSLEVEVQKEELKFTGFGVVECVKHGQENEF